MSYEGIPSAEVLVEKKDVLLFQTDLSGDEGTLNDDSTYYITWTVYIALAFTPEQGHFYKDNNKGKQTVFSKSNPDQVCYHIEYKLLPGDTEANKVDLLLFGPVAKLYKEDESKLLKTWSEAGQTWVGWNQHFNVKVNRAMAISLLSHKFTVHIWNNKDKLSCQARIERQKVLRLDHPDDGEMQGGVKTVVNNMRSLCGIKSTKRKTFYSSTKLDVEDRNIDLLVRTDKNTAFNLAPEVGMASVEFSPVSLLAGEQSLTNWTMVSSCGVNESMIHISLDRPFLSDQLKAELNPLAITILSANSMPPTPVPFHVLEEKCMPVYCQYKFHNLKVHRTNYERHSDKIYFRDVNVILTGLLNPQDLHEFLLGPPMKIEIHDRGRKLDGKTPVGFGCGFNNADPNDACQNQKTEDFSYYGIASLNFSELLFGRTNFKVSLPIKCCYPSLPEMDIRTKNQLIPPGHYLEANSELRVRIKLTCPLNLYNAGSKMSSFEGLFGRIVYIFDCSNFAVMDKLRSNILKCNAEVFGVDSQTVENTEKALLNYTTHFKQGRSQDLDFVTGFHVVDKKTQIVVVEGLKHKAVKRLWEAVPMKLSGSKEEQVIVLYNSSLDFLKRIYDTLDLGLRPIFLPESLETITKEPLLYITGTVPQKCLQALLRLNQLCQVRSLKDAVQYNLFPSADMIVSLSRQYETSFKDWKQNLSVTSRSEQSYVPVTGHLTFDTTNTKEYTYSNFSNQDVVFRKQKDFIQENIKKVQEDSRRLQKPVITMLRLKTTMDRTAHNYSIQSFNSNELNKKWLQREMDKLPGRRFTFCQEYQSATVEPGQYSDVLKTKDSTSDTAEVFTTLQGQVPVLEADDMPVKPGYRSASFRAWDSSINRSKMHPQNPDPARVEELRKPWRENILHGNILKPPLCRDPWTWSERSQDFQLYSKAAPFFSSPPVSLYLAGASLQDKQTSAAKAQYSRWMKKLPSGDGSSGPVPEFKCHMAGTDKFQDILKDKPQKYSLRKPGMLLKPVPKLSVISHSADATEVQRSLAPGPCRDCSLTSKNNAVPRHNSEFHKYQYMRFDRKPSLLYKRAAAPLTEEKDVFTYSRGVTNHICKGNSNVLSNDINHTIHEAYATWSD